MTNGFFIVTSPPLPQTGTASMWNNTVGCLLMSVDLAPHSYRLLQSNCTIHTYSCYNATIQLFLIPVAKNQLQVDTNQLHSIHTGLIAIQRYCTINGSWLSNCYNPAKYPCLLARTQIHLIKSCNVLVKQMWGKSVAITSCS